MKSVIYKIVFENGDFYIGQTGNWEVRKAQHIRNKGKGSPLLEKAFLKYPNPAFHVLEETRDLDAREIWWIDHLKPTLNVLPGGTSMRGLNHPRSFYTEQAILDVVEYWTTTTLSCMDISVITGVKYGTVRDVVHGRTHTWATQGIDLRSHDRTHSYKIYDPQGNCFEGNTLRELEAKTGIGHSTLNSIITSKSGCGRNGWAIYPPTKVVVTAPDGTTHTTTTALVKQLLKDEGLSPYSIQRLTKEFKPSSGWKIAICP